MKSIRESISAQAQAIDFVRAADDLKIAQHFSAGKRTNDRFSKPAKRATDELTFDPTNKSSAVRFTDSLFFLSSDPTDESVGYFLSSASRTTSAA
jgi:hypothetical protein